MKIFPLSEGSFTVDRSKQFVPYTEGTDSLAERNRGSLLVEIQPFLVQTKTDLLLLDTGLGFEKDGELQLLHNIRQAGFDSSQVTKVLLSHLHKDHAGGVGKEREGLGARLSLPSATYYVHEEEMNFAFEKGFPSFIPGELEGLRNNPGVSLMKGERGEIDANISFQVTGAHSPHHLVFWIKEDDEIIFFGADDAPQLHQMKHRFVAKYDHDGKKAMELRQQWWEKGAAESWTFLFYHDVAHPSWSFK